MEGKRVACGEAGNFVNEERVQRGRVRRVIGAYIAAGLRRWEELHHARRRCLLL